jgi:hypothetical protein
LRNDLLLTLLDNGILRPSIAGNWKIEIGNDKSYFLLGKKKAKEAGILQKQRQKVREGVEYQE